jgi:hypothetical protein
LKWLDVVCELYSSILHGLDLPYFVARHFKYNYKIQINTG